MIKGALGASLCVCIHSHTLLTMETRSKKNCNVTEKKEKGRTVANEEKSNKKKDFSSSGSTLDIHRQPFLSGREKKKKERNKIAEQRAAERVESGGDGTSKSDDWKM